VTEEEQAQAILAALNGVLGDAEAFDIDGVPTERPDRYVVIDITRRWMPEQLASGEVPIPGWFLTTEYHARNVNDVREMRRRTQQELEDQVLPGDAGPFAFQTADEITSVDGWCDSADTWTY
jgi:hypothetical protein